MGKFDPVTDSNFIEIKLEHADRVGLYLRKDTYSAFLKMYEAAQRDSIRLVIRSATRNFDNQKKIWENKWSGETPLESNKRANLIANETIRAKEILKYSSMPGSSRHHWGTDIDLNAFSNHYFEQGEGLKIYQWLNQNAPEFGFCQPYTEKGLSRLTGYEEEKWHWSYLPVSGHLIRQARASLRDDLINGFQGSEQAIQLGIVDNYVLGIDSLCLNIEHQTDLINN
jgi:LAS superfamily LD-carboxypeptidase LdcB